MHIVADPHSFNQSVTSNETTSNLVVGEAWLLPVSASARPIASGGGEADALKLDTSSLTGNHSQEYRPPIVPFSKEVYGNRPINYPIYENSHAFRLKIQPFSDGGYEAVICSIPLQRHADIQSLNLPRGKRTERKGDEESIEKSVRRSRRMVRLKCKQAGVDHLMTLTTREIISKEDIKSAFARFTDLLAYHFKRKFEYVCVCEPHPTNPEHLHLHLAIRGRLDAREMVIVRRSWYVALGGSGNEKGASVPGGFNIRHIKVHGGASRRSHKIASYLAKYITKDIGTDLNKKRYWASRIDLEESRSFWLRALTLDDALAEVMAEFSVSVGDLKTDFFRARNMDLIWMNVLPDI